MTERKRPGKTWATLTDEDKRQLVEMYEGGATGYRCAKMLGVDDGTAITWLRKLGVKIRPKGGSAECRNRGGGSADPTSKGAIVCSPSIMERPRLYLDQGRRWM